jgi:DNA-binding HxlR family transcriptional regulator
MPSRRHSAHRSVTPPSALAEAVDRVGDRWTLLMVDALMGGPRRFGELADDVGRIAPNVLTARLRQLEIDGVVRATPYSRRPLRMEYELTDAGRELAGALALLAAWGRRQAGGVAGRVQGEAQGPEHVACGTVMVTRLWCPTCDRAVDDPEADELEHL